MPEKKEFIKLMTNRTKQFAVDIIHFCESLDKNPATSVITYQLIKSATSTGANYRAACKPRSKKEFFSKICIVVEEADETEYWLEIIRESKMVNDLKKVNILHKEANEISRIMSKAKNTMYKN